LLGPFSDELPQYVCEQLKQSEFNSLRVLLSRSQIKEIIPSTYFQTLQSVICPQSDSSICELSAAFDQVECSSGYLYRLDPVHFKAESDHAVLLGGHLLNIQKDEALQLIDTFNQHFVDESIRLHFGEPGRWYLETKTPLALSFNTIDYSLGRDIKHFMPTGDDALWWRKILNEAQMLFFSHPVNQQREDNARLSVNGLWLWDFHFQNIENEPNVKKIYADDDLVKAMASHASLSASSLVQFDNDVSAKSEFEGNISLVFDEVYNAVCYGDIDAWFEALQSFCVNHLPGIYSLLKSNAIDGINVYPCDGRKFYVDRWQLLKFWKRTSSIENYVSKVS